MSGFPVSNAPFDDLIRPEWLITNGIGGYASSSLPCLNTRKYHGLLVAAMAPPVRRMVILSRMEETVRFDGWGTALNCNEYPGTIHPQGHQQLQGFSNDPFPRWAYQGHGWTLEKGLRLLKGENTALLTYTLLGGDRSVELELRPLFALRPIHELMYQWNGMLAAEHRGNKAHHRIPPTTRTPEAFFAHDGVYHPQGYWYLNSIYRLEQERGYGGLEDLWSPGVVRMTLAPGHTAHFACSTDPIDLPRVMAEADRQVSAPPIVISSTMTASMPSQQPLEALVHAADQFVVDCAPNPNDAPAGVEPLTAIITDYPWAAPSVRNALIAFPGLLLVTGKFSQAKSFLRSLIAKLDQGLLPSEFPESGGTPLYKGADVSLWFINAVHHFLRYTNDYATVQRQYFDAMLAIVDAYRHGGAPLGVNADEDGLLSSHAPGLGTSWMDAKVGDWVITPRQGAPVELSALWYNALRIVADLALRFDHASQAQELSALSIQVKTAFNKRFWNPETDCCFDVIDSHGHDASIRPNQVLAMSLPFPVLSPDRHSAVLSKIETELLTPMGLRTLSPRDPAYQGRYMGNVVSRDRAYHQGSAYPWLLGHYITAQLRLRGRSESTRQNAEKLVAGCLAYLDVRGIGQLCELADGDTPHRPGGAPASARSVGELLRCYVEDILDQSPKSPTPNGAIVADIITSAQPSRATPPG